jgi:hypothetical protein
MITKGDIFRVHGSSMKGSVVKVKGERIYLTTSKGIRISSDFKNIGRYLRLYSKGVK